MENSITIFSIIDGDQCFRRRPFLRLSVARGKKRKNDSVTKVHFDLPTIKDPRLPQHIVVLLLLMMVDVPELGGMFFEKEVIFVDASMVVALCLGVVSPASSGIGGGAFMLLRLANGTMKLLI
ncbi:Glutathione hydrolase 2 [Camellia lanceoleosa]|nr:Glutathione hydrolase 2 [Camellia lanceoleosa]